MISPNGLPAQRTLVGGLSALIFLIAILTVDRAHAQSAQASPYERPYPQSKSAVEKALKELQPALSGRLPGLEGFAVPGDHPLSRYQRAFYQSTVQVKPSASGGSVVRISSKVTAWYADPVPSRSGYQMLVSNGRLENDFLDQLNDVLASMPNATTAAGTATGKSGESSSLGFPTTASSSEKEHTARSTPPRGKNVADSDTTGPTLSAPLPRSGETGSTFPSSAPRAPTREEIAGMKNAPEAQTVLTRLVDEGLLDGMRLVGSSQTFESGDLRSHSGFHGGDARANSSPFQDHGAGSALAQAAAELGATQFQIVAQHVQQRCRRVHIHAVGFTVHL